MSEISACCSRRRMAESCLRYPFDESPRAAGAVHVAFVGSIAGAVPHPRKRPWPSAAKASRIPVPRYLRWFRNVCGGFTTPEFQYHGTCGGFATAEFQYHGICGPLRETSIPVINLYYDLSKFPLGHRNVKIQY